MILVSINDETVKIIKSANKSFKKIFLLIQNKKILFNNSNADQEY